MLNERYLKDKIIEKENRIKELENALKQVLQDDKDKNNVTVLSVKTCAVIKNRLRKS